MLIPCFQNNLSYSELSKLKGLNNMGLIKFLNKTPLSKVPGIGDFLKRPIIPVIRFSGIITDSQRSGAISYERYRKLIDKAFKAPNLKAVVLIVNCPGGTPAQSQLRGNYIRRRAGEENVPVYAFVEDLAASGGYWLACAADYIYAVNTSIVGSIGVVSASFGLDKFIAKYDIQRRVYTQGDQKSMLDPFLPEKDADVKRLKAVQKDMHEDFISWVKDRRGDRLKGNDTDLFEGQIWTGKAAVNNGIIDKIGECNETLKAEFGENYARIDIQPDKRLLSIPSLRQLRASACDSEFSSGLSRDILNTLEDKSLWTRFGF